MQNGKKSNQYYFLSIGFGFWFLLTSWMWVYLMNMFISYPVGVMGFFLWKKARKDNPNTTLSAIALGFLIAGVISSVVSAILYK